MAHWGQEKHHEVYVQNTFLCVREDSDESGDESPLVRHIRSDPAGCRQLPQTVRAARKDLLDECSPPSPEGESTSLGEVGQHSTASSHQESRSSLEEPMAWNAEPGVPNASRAAKREPAGAAKDAMAPAWPASCSGPAHVAVCTPPTLAAQFCVTAVCAWPPQAPLGPLGHAVAARAVHTPDTQAGDVTRGAQLPASREVLHLTTTAFPEEPALQGPASWQESREVAGKDSAHVSWTVDGWNIHSTKKKIASPRFCICLPNGPCPFQLVLYAQSKSRFRCAHGRGRVEMRCEAELPKGFGKITFRLSLGDQPPQPPVSHDFSQQLCCGLRRLEFGSAADPATGTLGVHLEIVALGESEGPFASALLSPAPARHGGA